MFVLGQYNLWSYVVFDVIHLRVQWKALSFCHSVLVVKSGEPRTIQGVWYDGERVVERTEPSSLPGVLFLIAYNTYKTIQPPKRIQRVSLLQISPHGSLKKEKKKNPPTAS